MPCNSDYMNPNEKEKNSKEVAELLVYVYEMMDMNSVLPNDVIIASKEHYGNPENLDWFVSLLCELCNSMTHKERDDIIYGKSRISRRLADWWEDHQEADRKREALEAIEKRRQDLLKSARAKLTQEEKDAIRWN